MIALNFIDAGDGCELSEQELLSIAKAGFSDGPVATAEELAEELKKLPVEGKNLSDEQLNFKLARSVGWKFKNHDWNSAWHDELGDGPPLDYCTVLGRKLAENIADAPDDAPSAGATPAI